MSSAFIRMLGFSSRRASQRTEGLTGSGGIHAMTYGVPGRIAIPALSDAPNYIGTALDVNLTWHIERHVIVQASYVHFLTGSYVHEGGGRDLNFFSTTITFLF